MVEASDILKIIVRHSRQGKYYHNIQIHLFLSLWYYNRYDYDLLHYGIYVLPIQNKQTVIMQFGAKMWRRTPAKTFCSS